MPGKRDEESNGDSTLIDMRVKKKAGPMIAKWVGAIITAIGVGAAAWKALEVNVATNTMRLDDQDMINYEFSEDIGMVEDKCEALEDRQLVSENNQKHMMKTMDRMANQVEAIYNQVK